MERTEIAILIILALEVFTFTYAAVTICIRNAKLIKARRVQKEEALDLFKQIFKQEWEKDRKIEFLLSGEELVTRGGKKVKVLNRKGYPIVATYEDPATKEKVTLTYTADGRYVGEADHELDIIIPDAEPESKEE